MKKRKFSNSERFVLWNHYGEKCYWCHEPLRFLDTSIDHVVPESLLGNTEKLQTILRMYDLPSDFQVNSFENWLPCHGHCNGTKSSKIFNSAPVFLNILRKLALEAPKVRSKLERLISNSKIDNLIGMMLIAVELGSANQKKVLAAFDDDELQSFPGFVALRNEFKLHIDEKRWKIVSASEAVATVTDGSRAGLTPVNSSPDLSWVCPTCGSHGPWSGAICLNCGHKSDPND